MKYLIETVEEKQKVLIIDNKSYSFVNLLKLQLKKYGMEIFLSPRLPKNIEKFDYCFLIKNEQLIHIYLKQKNKQTVMKQVFIQGDIIDNLQKNDLDKILWFTFSKTSESTFNLPIIKIKRHRQKLNFSLSLSPFKQFLTKKNIFLSIVILFIFFHLIFLLPFFISSYLSYQAAESFKKNNFSQTKNLLAVSLPLFNLSKRLYHFSRPTFLLFSMASFPDDIMAAVKSGNIVLNELVTIQENWQTIQALLFEKNKSEQQKKLVAFRLKKFNEQISIISENLNILNQKIPHRINYFKKTKNQLTEVIDALSKIKKILPYFDVLLAGETEKKYILFFANNMELRPGGGFLGSLGILKIKDYTVEDLQIYDVYDLDGQLTVHIDPPEPIKKYLNMPHWFLRDSNFSPDFLENYNQAKIFLEKEMGWKDFSGAILLTTSAVRNFLEAFDNIYLPDFNERIDAKNFYIKTQMYVEKGFFPGSIQKKSFLGALTKQVLINLSSSSTKKLATALKKSLDDKQLVFFFENTNLQSIIDSFYWSGRVINPDCLPTLPNCLSNYLLAYDANLGVNKVNFFINRIFNLQININRQGEINHKLSILFKNNSPAMVFPGGLYRNFFQIMIPKNSKVSEVTKNDVLVEDYEETNGEKFKIIGFLVEVEPKKTTEVKIIYQLNNQLPKGKSIYQLIVQKQIGASNNDFILDLNLGKNIYLLNQNFSPLVKNNHILYNTVLSHDKIFFMELIRE